jgi:trk system potassium uptake protein
MALASEGHSVAVIDRSQQAFRRLPPEVECKRVVGSGFDRDDLERAGAVGADALAAVTAGDNSNILTVRIARETYEIPRVVARIKDPRRAEIYQRLGIPTVATVTWTTDQVRRRLLPESAAPEWSDASGRLALVERPLPEGWAGRKLADLEEPGQVSLLAVTRAGEPRLDARELLGQEGDVLLFGVRSESEAVLQSRLDGHDPVVVPDQESATRGVRRGPARTRRT